MVFQAKLSVTWKVALWYCAVLFGHLAQAQSSAVVDMPVRVLSAQCGVAGGKHSGDAGIAAAHQGNPGAL